MKIKELIETTKNIYEEALLTKKQNNQEKTISYAKKEMEVERQKRIERLNKSGISTDTISEVEASYSSELSEYDKVLEGLKHSNSEEINKSNTEKYINAVKDFSNAGGRDFYDIGSLVSVKYHFESEIFETKIKEMQDAGIDIKILHKEKLSNEKNSMYGTDSKYAIVMPSSAYNDYERMMVENFNEEMFDTSSSALRNNFFIAPLIELRNKIDGISKEIIKLIELPKNNEKRMSFNRNIFSPLGYSTYSLDTKSGYGVFEEYKPSEKALDNAVNYVLECVDLYGNKKDSHSNSMMPSIIFYSNKEQKSRNPLDTENKKIKFNIRDGIKGYELENPATKEKLENNKRLKNNKIRNI